MSFSSRAASSGRRVVNHFSSGTRITLRKGTGALTPGRGVAAGSQSMTLVCTRPAPFGKALVDGERVQAGDLRVKVAKGDPLRTFEIVPELLATIGSKNYRVVDVLDADGDDELQLRGRG